MKALTEAEAREIGIEAYYYFYSLISMDITRRVVTNLPAGVKDGLGPANQFHHMRSFPTAEFHEVVRPNFDTLYSAAWLDLAVQPMIITAPDTAGRYYLLPMLDMWSDVFAVPGSRTSGTGAGAFAVCPPGWHGALPAGVMRIQASTPHVWVIGRTQTNGPQDYDAVHRIQDGYTVTPLSRWGESSEAPAFVPDTTIDMSTPPLLQVDTMSASRYFSYGAELMRTNPPHVTDWSILARLKRIGIVAGESFDFDAAPQAVRAGLEGAIPLALGQMRSKVSTLAPRVNGWQMDISTMGVYGNFYLKRAIIAQVGLGANQPEDAIYPLCVSDADGRPLQGELKYVLHFASSELPPAAAFWSVTMYDAQGFQVANALNRFAIGDRDALKFNADGSLDLYIQHDSPGAERESNWLPAPASGELAITLRLYAPKSTALDGTWAPPAVRRIA